MQTYHTSSSLRTKSLGQKLAKQILREPNSKRAKLLSFVGDLGAGKTTFIQGFLKAAGYKGRVTSPTFIFMRRHAIKNKYYKNVFHVDAYRVRNEKDFKSLGFEKELNNPQNIFLVEWGGNIKTFLNGAKVIMFEHGKKENERSIKF